MSSEGPNSPDTGANDAAYGSLAWTSPGNVLASDNNRATAAVTNVNTPTQYLKATDFDFAIPSGATIDGIIVEIERSATANACRDDRVRIVKADGSIGTSDKASGTDWATGADQVFSYGGAADLWGESWTPADINDVDFGVVLAVKWISGTPTARVDHIKITVHYTAGGTTYQKSLSGAVTPSGALARKTKKPVAGAVTPSGALARKANKTLAGSVSPSGALTRKPRKVFAGTATPSGTVSRKSGKALSGSVSPSGSLARSLRKLLAGEIIPSGTLTRKTSKSFAGAATPTGAESHRFIIVRAFAGAISPTGVLTRAIRKVTGGTVTPSGAVTKRTSRLLAGSATPTGTLTRKPRKSFAGSITPTATLVRKAKKRLAGAVTPTGALTRTLRRRLAGAITPSGQLRRKLRRSFAGAISPSGVVTVVGAQLRNLIWKTGRLLNRWILGSPGRRRDWRIGGPNE